MTTGGVAVLLAAVLVGDAFGVAKLRADQQRAEREELRRAEASFREALLPLATEVQRVEAPLDAAFMLDLEGEGGLNVRYDVYANGKADADLAAIAQRLAAVPVPATRRAAHDAFTAALARMTETAGVLAADTQAERSIVAARDAFSAAGRDWDRVAATELGPTPEPAALDGPGPQTRAGVLYRWGRSCAVGDAKAAALPNAENDPDAAAAALPGYAATVEQVRTEVLAVEGPAADAAPVDEVKAPLRELADSRRVLEDFAQAIRARDARAFARVLLEIERLELVLERATGAFERYGSTTCAGFFDPGTGEGEGDTTA